MTEDGRPMVEISDFGLRISDLNTEYRFQISDLRIPAYVRLGELRRASRFKYRIRNTDFRFQIGEVRFQI